jgi:hypothetical protein
MKIDKDTHGGQPARGELRPLLLLVVLSPFGLLMWVGLFLALRWSVLIAWSAAVGA